MSVGVDAVGGVGVAAVSVVEVVCVVEAFGSGATLCEAG